MRSTFACTRCNSSFWSRGNAHTRQKRTKWKWNTVLIVRVIHTNSPYLEWYVNNRKRSYTRTQIRSYCCFFHFIPFLCGSSLQLSVCNHYPASTSTSPLPHTHFLIYIFFCLPKLSRDDFRRKCMYEYVEPTTASTKCERWEKKKNDVNERKQI